MEGMIVIFGATGDLMKKKLAPALYSLYLDGALTERHPVVCVGRKSLTMDEFIRHLDTGSYVSEADEEEFHNLIQYVVHDFEQPTSSLDEALDSIKERFNAGDDIIFYLALPPSLFKPVTDKLASSRLMKGKGFRRVAFEKPFGSDLKSATELNDAVRGCFDESQIYRIDHYLAKELVLELFSFRFSNRLLNEMWCRENIDHVQVQLTETAGVGGRAGYYDTYGAIRDMLQNHIMHIIALTTMDEPKSLGADDIRDKKVKALSSLRPIDPSEIVIGQYT